MPSSFSDVSTHFEGDFLTASDRFVVKRRQQRVDVTTAKARIESQLEDPGMATPFSTFFVPWLHFAVFDTTPRRRRAILSSENVTEEARCGSTQAFARTTIDFALIPA